MFRCARFVLATSAVFIFSSLASAAPPPAAAGDVFHDALDDGSSGPEMVVLPAGLFRQGSASDEPGRDPDEGPQRIVGIAAFALGRTEVTRADFTRFVTAAGYKTAAELDLPALNYDKPAGCFAYDGEGDFGWRGGTSWRDPGYPQEDTHPVACLSWHDATAYVAWLRAQTGQPYRLPSESELEYGIRAGTDTPWPWGSDPQAGCEHANYADRTAQATFADWDTAGCSDGALFTSAAASRRPNAFGLHDTSGNVWEWTQDCSHKNYSSAPTDGSAWEAAADGDCTMRILRGGGWDDVPVWVRSANRVQDVAEARFYYSGFRVARDLTTENVPATAQ